MANIADHFFRQSAVKLTCDFKRTDLFKILETIYGPLIYVAEPGFFISVCKHGKETWLMEKIFFNAADWYGNAVFYGQGEGCKDKVIGKGFYNDKGENPPLVEIGCWIPASLRKFIHRKKPEFPIDYKYGFNLSRGGYCVIDIESDRDWEFLTNADWDNENLSRKTEKIFHKYLPKNTIFDRMDHFDPSYYEHSITKNTFPYRSSDEACLVKMVINLCSTKAQKEIRVGTYKWHQKMMQDILGKCLEERTIDSKLVNVHHAAIKCEPRKAIVFNLFNPRYYHHVLSTKGKHRVYSFLGSYKGIIAEATQNSN